MYNLFMEKIAQDDDDLELIDIVKRIIKDEKDHAEICNKKYK